jgi:hypothetical protein
MLVTNLIPQSSPRQYRRISSALARLAILPLALGGSALLAAYGDTQAVEASVPVPSGCIVIERTAAQEGRPATVTIREIQGATCGDTWDVHPWDVHPTAAVPYGWVTTNMVQNGGQLYAHIKYVLTAPRGYTTYIAANTSYPQGWAIHRQFTIHSTLMTEIIQTRGEEPEVRNLNIRMSQS